MKNLFFLLVFLVTCFYFLSAGNLALFSKLGKGTVTEILDLDEDSADSEGKEGKEGKDSKEDSCGEEDFLDLMHTARLARSHSACEISFFEKSFLIPQHIAEKTGPPPKA